MSSEASGQEREARLVSAETAFRDAIAASDDDRALRAGLRAFQEAIAAESDLQAVRLEREELEARYFEALRWLYDTPACRPSVAAAVDEIIDPTGKLLGRIRDAALSQATEREGEE